VLPSVHIQLLKEYVPRDKDAKIGRVTSVFDPDTETDTLDGRYTEVQVRGERIDQTG